MVAVRQSQREVAGNCTARCLSTNNERLFAFSSQRRTRFKNSSTASYAIGDTFGQEYIVEQRSRSGHWPVPSLSRITLDREWLCHRVRSQHGCKLPTTHGRAWSDDATAATATTAAATAAATTTTTTTTEATSKWEPDERRAADDPPDA